ncbi:MAG: glycosyltransferase family 2 protein [Bacteroidota bacterium]
MASFRILVVVITHNGDHWIADCLGSLRKSIIPLDVIVIDNQSTDDTVATIKQNFPEVQLVESKRNLGFGQGNNVGMKKGLQENYDYVFLLNQDAWIDPDTVKILIETHQQYPEYGILNPMQVNRRETSLDRNFAGYLSQTNNISLMSDLLLPHLSLQKVYSMEFINAAAWFISRECLRTVGGFDPLFPHYGEDQDYVQRARYHRFKIGFTPHTKVIHDREGYVKQSDKRRSLATQYNRSLILLKNVRRAFSANLAVFLRNELYYILVALATLDIDQFVTKLKLFYRVFRRLSAIRINRKYCATHRGAFLT